MSDIIIGGKKCEKLSGEAKNKVLKYINEKVVGPSNLTSDEAIILRSICLNGVTEKTVIAERGVANSQLKPDIVWKQIESLQKKLVSFLNNTEREKYKSNFAKNVPLCELCKEVQKRGLDYNSSRQEIKQNKSLPKISNPKSADLYIHIPPQEDPKGIVVTEHPVSTEMSEKTDEEKPFLDTLDFPDDKFAKVLRRELVREKIADQIPKDPPSILGIKIVDSKEEKTKEDIVMDPEPKEKEDEPVVETKQESKDALTASVKESIPVMKKVFGLVGHLDQMINSFDSQLRDCRQKSLEWEEKYRLLEQKYVLKEEENVELRARLTEFENQVKVRNSQDDLEITTIAGQLNVFLKEIEGKYPLYPHGD